MAVQNVIGDAFRGATWVALHNGGGVGWGEVINGKNHFQINEKRKENDEFFQEVSVCFWTEVSKLKPTFDKCCIGT